MLPVRQWTMYLTMETCVQSQSWWGPTERTWTSINNRTASGFYCSMLSGKFSTINTMINEAPTFASSWSFLSFGSPSTIVLNDCTCLRWSKVIVMVLESIIVLFDRRWFSRNFWVFVRRTSESCCGSHDERLSDNLLWHSPDFQSPRNHNLLPLGISRKLWFER